MVITKRAVAAWAGWMMVWTALGCTQPSQERTDGQGASQSSDNQASAVEPVAWGEVAAVQGDGALSLCRPQCQSAAVGAPVELGANISTDQAARATLRLGDGTRVVIDTGARLSMVDKDRMRLESGRMVLETASDLKVETPHGLVQARPGAMTITAEAQRTRLGVISGQLGGGEGNDAQLMTAGQSGVLGSGQTLEMLPGVNLAYQTAWSREMTVEAEESNAGDEAPRGIGSIHGKDPASRRILPEAITIPELKVHATVRERVARTEIEQVFENTTNRTLEGIYTFPLPPDASIVRFGMEIKGEMMEGEIVERGRANQIFNSVVADYMRPKDPAMLEWVGGNTFRIRIFPIFPKARQRVVLWYTQAVSGAGADRRYTYPLPRTGKIGIDNFAFSADINTPGQLQQVRTPLYASSVDTSGQRASVQFNKENFHPRQDMVMEWASAERTDATVFAGADRRAGQDPYFMMVLRPSLSAFKAPEEGGGTQSGAGAGPRDHLFIVDTSYNTPDGDLKAASAAVAAYVSTLGPDDRFMVMAANQSTTLWKPQMSRVNSAHLKDAVSFLDKQQPGGASDLEGALREGARVLRGSTKPVVVYIGDGQATLGETRHWPLLDALDQSLGSVSATVHAIGLGSQANVALLRALTRRFAGATAMINRGEDVPGRVREMALATRRPALRQVTAAFSSDKIDLVYPTRLPTLYAGDEVVLVGRFKGKVDGQVTLTGLVGDEPFAQPFRVKLAQEQAQPRSFVPRLWAQQHIEHLTLHGEGKRNAEIIETSTQHTVLSRLTTFLVLESERMYQRFRVDRDRNRDYWKQDLGSLDEGEEEQGDEDGDKAAETKTLSPAQRETRRLQGQESGPLFKDLGDAEAESLDNDVLAQPNAAPAAEPVFQDSPMPDAKPMAGANRNTGGFNEGIDDLLGDMPAAPRGNVGGKRGNKDVTTKRPAPAPRGPSDARDAAPVMPKEESKGRASSRPAAKAKPRRPRRAKKSLNAFDGGGGGGGWAPPPPPRATIRSVSPEPGQINAKVQARFEESIKREPLKRTHRLKLINALMRAGDAQEARRALESWLERDPLHARVHWMLGDVLARLGEHDAARLHFGNAVELAPGDSEALHRWALSLMMRGEHKLAASALRTVAAQTGSVDYGLDLVAVEALVAPLEARARLAALRANTALNKAQTERADGLATVLVSGRGDALEGMPGAERKPRGAMLVTMGWQGDVDLDLSLVLPYGERISPDMPRSTRGGGRRGYVATQSPRGLPVGDAARTPLEAIAASWAGRGRYLVEVTRRDAGQQPVQAWVKVRAMGVTRTFQITVPAGARSARVASIQVNY